MKQEMEEELVSNILPFWINRMTDEVNGYLPVSVPGAGLAVGDLHACMGDGELSGTGIAGLRCFAHYGRRCR